MKVVLSDYSEESESMLCKEIKEIEMKEAEETARIAAEQAELEAELERKKKQEVEFQKKKEKLPELFARTGKEGFDNLPWGTELDFFLWLNPNAQQIESDGSILQYQFDGEQNTKIFKFYDNKLVGGVTVFSYLSEEKINDINIRLKQLYGKPSDTKDLTKRKSENLNIYGVPYPIFYTDGHIRVIWNKSATFKIQYDFTARELDDAPGLDPISKAMLEQAPKIELTYSNEKKMAEIKASDAKKKKAADAEAQKKRIDNLDL